MGERKAWIREEIPAEKEKRIFSPRSAMLRKTLLPALLLLLPSCWSVHKADYLALEAKTKLHFSEGEPPDRAITLGSISVTQNGFYFLGFIPIVPINLQESMEVLAGRAKKMGASGIAKIWYKVDPPGVLKYVAFPIPDWSAGIQITGMAWRAPHQKSPR